MSKRTRPKTLVCEGCGEPGAKIVVLDDAGLQAGVFQFCVLCTPKLKYRTGDYVIRWFRISPKLPPSRKPHRDVDLFAMPRWGDENYISPYDKFQASKRRKRKPKSKKKSEEEDKHDDDDDVKNEQDEPNEGKEGKEGKDGTTEQPTTTPLPTAARIPKHNFLAALSAAKEAGPMPAHVKPLKRLALEVAVNITMKAHYLGAFERLRLRLPESLQELYVEQMIENNRLFDFHKRKALEAETALMEAHKGDTLKEIEAHAAEFQVEEHPEAVHAVHSGGKKEEEKEKDSCTIALEEANPNNKEKWKQYSKYFLNALHSFVWDMHPQSIDLSSCGLGPRDLNLLLLTISKQTVGTLNLKWNLLGSKNAGFLYQMIACNCVHTLHLGWNQLGDDGVMVLSSALPKAKALKDLDLTGNGITKVGLRHLCIAINASGRTKNKNKDEDEDEDEDKDGANNNSKTSMKTPLKRLNLSFNPIGAEGAMELIESGLGEVPLTHVGLRSCELGVHGATTIALGFRKNRHLVSMMLADNRVTPEGARQIARNLKLTPSALLRAFGVGSGTRSAGHARNANAN